MRESVLDKTIVSPKGVAPYPKAGTEISDKQKNDGGNNFGSIARIGGLMDDYISITLRTLLASIPAIYWIDFFITFVDNNTKESIENELEINLP
jgi:hypothetical protein